MIRQLAVDSLYCPGTVWDVWDLVVVSPCARIDAWIGGGGDVWGWGGANAAAATQQRLWWWPSREELPGLSVFAPSGIRAFNAVLRLLRDAASPCRACKAQAGQECLHKLPEGLQEVRRCQAVPPLRQVRHAGGLR